MLRRALPLLALFTATTGCYLAHEEEPASCVLPARLPGPSVQRLRHESCSTEAVDLEGSTWSSECDGLTCTLRHDDTAICECTSLDLGNVCGDGRPTCADWPIFDMSDVVFIDER